MYASSPELGPLVSKLGGGDGTGRRHYFGCCWGSERDMVAVNFAHIKPVNNKSEFKVFDLILKE